MDTSDNPVTAPRGVQLKSFERLYAVVTTIGRPRRQDINEVVISVP